MKISSEETLFIIFHLVNLHVIQSFLVNITCHTPNCCETNLVMFKIFSINSSLSSSLNSMAAVAWKDLLESKFGHIKESQKALINKVLGRLTTTLQQ